MKRLRLILCLGTMLAMGVVGCEGTPSADSQPEITGVSAANTPQSQADYMKQQAGAQKGVYSESKK